MPQITSLESVTGIGRNISVGRNSGDGILKRNIWSFGLFEVGTSYIFDISTSWHGAAEIESENPREKEFSKCWPREYFLFKNKFRAKIM